MRIVIAIFFLSLFHAAHSQVSVSPAFPSADEEVTITYDATQGTTGLGGAQTVMMHSGVVLSGVSGTAWENVKGVWGDPNSVGSMTSLGNNKWQIKIVPRTYFGVAAGVRIFRIGMVFREGGPCGGFSGTNTACKEGKSPGNGNIYVDLFEADQFVLSLTEPMQFPLFRSQGETLSIKASVSKAADVTVSINGSQVFNAQNVTSISYDHVIAESAGTSNVVVSAVSGAEVKQSSFSYIIRKPTVLAKRPAGIVDGINYSQDLTKATLSLWAPGKTSVYVFGDFSDWKILSTHQMKQDGEHFWLELAGLDPDIEYGFQYLVDETLRVADPYSDKILDPDDQYIPASVYPGLKPFPVKALSDKFHENRVSVLKTRREEYQWQVDNFQKIPVQNLVIYELLIRDFFGPASRSYEALSDTLTYLKRLGINAVQLMPIMEFNGNDSWGYNPTFMFAPDKAYGTKNQLKAFIDECHKNGIAVILDIAMNHHDIPNPYVLMDYDFAANKPRQTNKWFNPDAKHPYNVFFDFNHESDYTKRYLDTVNYYWLKEYKIDGFRFDLSKGFTQNDRCAGSTSNENCFSERDESRIAILKRMGTEIWKSFPDAYLILEHFAQNNEEKELAEFGFMFWGNLNHAYSQNSMGFSQDSDISWISHKQRTWSKPHVIGYMESHDEERLMVRNIGFGNTSTNYSVRNLTTALNRVKASSAMFFTIPGPKMLWQFGELGYDVSINSNGRTGTKPVLWEYYSNPERRKVFDTFAALIGLRKTYSVFQTNDFVISGGNSLVKEITLRNTPYTTTPATTNQMNVYVVANFDVVSRTVTPAFPHTGNWFNYFSGGQSLTVTSPAAQINLLPGEFRLYTDVKLPATKPELNPFVPPSAPTLLSVAESERKVTISWSDNSLVEAGYYIYRRKPGEAPALIGTTGPAAASYQDSENLQAFTTYEYFVSAFNIFGSTPSNVLTIQTTDIVTSADDEVATYLSVFPNPVRDHLTVEVRSGRIIKGRLIRTSGETTEAVRLDENTWDLSRVPAGLFILDLSTTEGNRKVKIIKK